MDDTKRLELIAEAVRYCQSVRKMGMPSSCYSKALREPVHFLWERRKGNKIHAAKFRSKAAQGLSFGRGQLIYDHAIPFKRLQAELLNLRDVSTDSVRKTLSRFGTVVLITKKENELLNRKHYGMDMPKNWSKLGVFARYKAVGIKIVKNSNISR